MRRLSDERRPRLLTRCVALDVGNMLAKLSQLAGRIGPERGTAQHPAPSTRDHRGQDRFSRSSSQHSTARLKSALPPSTCLPCNFSRSTAKGDPNRDPAYQRAIECSPGFTTRSCLRWVRRLQDRITRSISAMHAGRRRKSSRRSCGNRSEAPAEVPPFEPKERSLRPILISAVHAPGSRFRGRSLHSSSTGKSGNCP